MQALRRGSSRQTVKMPVIDIHNHFFPRTWPDLAARYGTPDWPWIKHTEPGKAEIMVGERFFRQIDSACWDPESTAAGNGSRWRRYAGDLGDSGSVCLRASGGTCAGLCAAVQRCGAWSCARRAKGRLKSLCQVPLQDIDAACKELTPLHAGWTSRSADRQSRRREESR